jgi:uncharacterized protein YsxB (DUF464 family)
MDQEGIIRACRSQGHALADRPGKDIVCAAVSVLLRTFLRITEFRDGVIVRADTQKGFIAFNADYTEKGRVFLFAAGSFLIEGLQSVSLEYPEYCKITVRRKVYGA